MLAPTRLGRNTWRRIAVLGCALAFLGGCGLQMFLRVDQRRVDDRLLYFLGGGGNSFAFLHPGGAFISDPKFGPGARTFQHDLEVDLGRRVQRILLTHWHFDHVGGLELYNPAVVLVHPKTRQRMIETGAKGNWVEVEHEVQLFLAGEKIRVLSLGSGHTDGDLVALFEKRRLLVAGDLLLDHAEPVIDLKSGGGILALGTTLDRLLELDFERVLPGHGEPLTRADVTHFRAYLTALETATRAAVAKGLDDEVAAKQISVAGFDDIQALVPGVNRETTIHHMLREVRAVENLKK